VWCRMDSMVTRYINLLSNYHCAVVLFIKIE
jgi:hypothetical protein